MTRSHTEEQTNMASYAEAFKNGPKHEDPNSLSSVKPVFILESDVFGAVESPSKALYLTINEMYEVVGKIVPNRGIKGLQRIRGLWRIYLDEEKEREKLLSEGLQLRGRSINVYSRNPRVSTRESPTHIRIRVKDVPLSADDGQILRALEEYQCSIVKHFRERLRYENMLTNCQTGDRIVFCQEPLTEPIPRTIPIGKYRATIIYRGQQSVHKPVKCTKCLEDGHKASECENDWRCKNCGETGHKQNTCTSGMFSHGEDINGNEEDINGHHDDVNSKEDDSNHSDGDSSESTENEDDDLTQAPQSAESEQCNESKELTQQSQSILDNGNQGPLNTDQSDETVPQSSDRLKVKANRPLSKQRESNKGQSQKPITDFIGNTPAKQVSSKGLEKSPVTPTEKLDDAVKRKKKKAKISNENAAHL